MVEACTLQDQSAQRIVGRCVHGDFLLNHRWAFAAQHFHVHRCFEISETQLNAPAPVIQGREFPRAIALRIRERGGQPYAGGAEAFALNGHLDDAHCDLCGQLAPCPCAPRTAGGPLHRFAPHLQPITFTQSLAVAHVLGAHLVKTKDAIHATLREFRHQRPGAEARVTEEHIAPAQEVSHLTPEAEIMTIPTRERVTKPATSGEAKDAQNLDHREPTARLLATVLGPATLICRSVRHGQAGAVDDLDRTPTPEPSASGTLFKAMKQRRAKGRDERKRKSQPSLTVGGRIQAGTLWIERTLEHPSANLADHLLASHARMEHLEEEGPKDGDGRVNAFALGERIGSGREEISGQERTDNGSHIWQSEVLEIGRRFVQNRSRGRLGAALEVVWEVR